MVYCSQEMVYILCIPNYLWWLPFVVVHYNGKHEHLKWNQFHDNNIYLMSLLCFITCCCLIFLADPKAEEHDEVDSGRPTSRHSADLGQSGNNNRGRGRRMSITLDKFTGDSLNHFCYSAVGGGAAGMHPDSSLGKWNDSIANITEFLSNRLWHHQNYFLRTQTQVGLLSVHSPRVSTPPSMFLLSTRMHLSHPPLQGRSPPSSPRHRETQTRPLWLSMRRTLGFSWPMRWRVSCLATKRIS